MKKYIPIIFPFLVIALTSYGQNKTLGVGTSTPNPNAALHVESPTSNQGFLMPRLTTAQRTAMASSLTAVDIGLIVYDTNLLEVFTWEGTSWVGDSNILPYRALLTNQDLLADINALDITYTGDSSRTLLNLNFANAANPRIANPFRITHAGQGAASVVTQSGTLGTGGIYQITNPANSSNALRATNSGTGIAGNFVVNNAANTSAAVIATTNGTGSALNASNTGTGNGFAGYFSNSNAANTFPAVQGTTTGPGSVFRAFQTTGPGAGIDVFMNNTTSTAVGFSVDQRGLGAAGNFNINNAGSSASGVFSTINGTGAAIQGQTSSGYAAIHGVRSGSTNGNAARFEISDAANAFPTLQSTTIGAGSAANFKINNSLNSASTLYSETNGTGDAIFGQKPAGSGSGSAGNFQNAEPTNNNSSLFALTNAVGGTALGLINSADGNALAIYQGGLKISNVSLSTPGAIVAKAGLYEISTPGSYTLPATGPVGETCWIANSSVGSVTINAVAPVANGTIRQFIRLTGGWQIVN